MSKQGNQSLIEITLAGVDPNAGKSAEDRVPDRANCRDFRCTRKCSECGACGIRARARKQDVICRVKPDDAGTTVIAGGEDQLLDARSGGRSAA